MSETPVALSPELGDMLRNRAASLTLEQKVGLLTGTDFWSLPAEATIGLGRVVLSDGPVGVRGELWDEREPSAAVPAPIALGATWDEASVRDVARVLASEARRKGVHVLLAPVLNLVRSPYAGRTFEYFGEDPLHAGRLGVAYAGTLQAAGIGATSKHFVANDSEYQRFTLNAEIDERTLRELYLAPFELVHREVHPWMVMAAYNAVNGPTMTEHPMLREVLGLEWGFDGVVVTDWLAGRTTVPSALAALDLLMPGPSGPWGDRLVAAVRAGEVPEAVVDEKVERILRLAARVGCLDGIAASPALDDRSSDADMPTVLRRVATRAMVLVKNDGLLPLADVALRRVALIGPNAIEPRVLGGGSATVFPRRVVNPEAGLRAALGDAVRIDTAPGVVADIASGTGADAQIERAPIGLLSLPDGGGAGLEVTFFAPDGRALRTDERTSSRLTYYGSFGGGLLPGDVGAIRVRTRVLPPVTGTYLLGCSGSGQFLMTVEGAVFLDATLVPDETPDPVDGLIRLPQQVRTIELTAGREALVETTLSLEPGRFAVRLELNLQAPLPDATALRAEAARLAASADVAVVVVGTTERIESEGFDRRTLALPAGQDELVRAVAVANPRTIVVVNAGAPVLMPWVDDVGAALVAWFPGEAFGDALADVLLGKQEPGGRLPVTWPARDEMNLPSTRPVDGTLVYREGLDIGYRGWERLGGAPAWWFGHGLGYTTWDYPSMVVPAAVPAGDPVTVTVRVQNTGDRRGREIVQVYASRPDSAMTRPVHWLAGFAAVEADAGETVEVDVAVAPRAFEHWDTSTHAWAVEPGRFTLEAGRSAGDLRVAGAVLIP